MSFELWGHTKWKWNWLSVGVVKHLSHRQGFASHLHGEGSKRMQCYQVQTNDVSCWHTSSGSKQVVVIFLLSLSTYLLLCLLALFWHVNRYLKSDRIIIITIPSPFSLLFHLSFCTNRRPLPISPSFSSFPSPPELPMFLSPFTAPNFSRFYYSFTTLLHLLCRHTLYLYTYIVYKTCPSCSLPLLNYTEHMNDWHCPRSTNRHTSLLLQRNWPIC